MLTAFFLFFPLDLCADEIYSTNGRYRCEIDRDLKYRLYQLKRDGVTFRPIPNKKRHVVSQLITDSFLALRLAEADARKLGKFIVTEGIDLTSNAIGQFGKKADRSIKRFLRKSVGKKFIEGVDKEDVSQVTVGELQSLIAELQDRKEEIRRLLRAAKREVRQCKGCASSRVNQRASRQSRRVVRRRKPCPCNEGEFSASLVFKTGTYGQCACYVLGFIQWEEGLSAGASSVDVVYDWSGGGAVERSETGTDPYNNALSLGEGEPTVSVPSGSNWIKILESYSVDFNTDRCAPECGDSLTALMGFASNPRIRTSCP